MAKDTTLSYTSTKKKLIGGDRLDLNCNSKNGRSTITIMLGEDEVIRVSVTANGKVMQRFEL